MTDKERLLGIINSTCYIYNADRTIQDIKNGLAEEILTSFVSKEAVEERMKDLVQVYYSYAPFTEKIMKEDGMSGPSNLFALRRFMQATSKALGS